MSGYGAAAARACGIYPATSFGFVKAGPLLSAASPPPQIRPAGTVGAHPRSDRSRVACAIAAAARLQTERERKFPCPGALTFALVDCYHSLTVSILVKFPPQGRSR